MKTINSIGSSSEIIHFKNSTIPEYKTKPTELKTPDNNRSTFARWAFV